MVSEVWGKLKAKEIFYSFSKKNHSDEELLSATQDLGVLPRSMLPARVTMPTKNLESFKLVEDGDFVISLRSFQGGIEYSKYRGIVSPAYTVLKNKVKISREFFRYYFKTSKFINDLDSSVVGIRDGKQISYKDFAEIYLPYPSLPEQKKIAAILSSVDDTIQATQAVIDQTRRVKQGLLQQLLTRGIGHTRFKQTEIGEIPEEWETGFLNRFCEQICVGFVGTCEKYYRNTGIPMIRTGNLKEGFLDSSKMKYVTHDFHQKHKKSQLKPGDLLIARHGKHGQACLVPESFSEANCLNVVIVRVNKDHFNPLFLQYLFNSNLIRQSIESKSAGSTQTVINTSEIARTLFPKPSLHEQIEIAEIIKTVDHSIDLDGDKLHSLYVIKRGLMQDLLTGLVRVKLDGEAAT